MIRNNESGYTLLLTLALILIITSFIGTLSFLTLNQQTQVEKTDEDFLLSDITEMGIEYYRSRVFEDYVRVIKQVKKNINEELNNFPEKYETKKEVEDLEIEKELEGIRDLKAILCTDEARANLCAYEVRAIPIEEPKLTFSLIESPYEFESTETYIQYKFLIEGSNSVNQEKYSFNIRLPKNLVDLSVTNPGNGSGTIDYSKTIKDPVFTPPLGTEYCDKNYTNTICVNNSDKKKETIGDIFNSTIYYTDDSVVRSENKHNFNDSLIYFDGNLEAQNIKDIQNVSIFVNGNTSFHQLIATNLNLYSFGLLKVNVHTYIYDSNIRSIGAVETTKKGMTISNTHMVLEGIGNEISPFNITNSSTVCLRNEDSLENLDFNIDSTSSVFIINALNQPTQNSDRSKQPLYVDENTFLKNCYGESDSNGGINVEIGEKDNFTPESILNEIDYNITD